MTPFPSFSRLAALTIGGDSGVERERIQRAKPNQNKLALFIGSFTWTSESLFFSIIDYFKITRHPRKRPAANKLETVVELHPPQAKSLPKGIENKPMLLQN